MSKVILPPAPRSKLSAPLKKKVAGPKKAGVKKPKPAKAKPAKAKSVKSKSKAKAKPSKKKGDQKRVYTVCIGISVDGSWNELKSFPRIVGGQAWQKCMEEFKSYLTKLPTLPVELRMARYKK